MKKEECWNLSINTQAGDGSSKSTPRKRTPKGTPASKKKGAVKAENFGDSDDDQEDFTPSKKKSTHNKVQSGRVSKATPARGRAHQSYAERSDDDEEDMAVKEESNALYFDSTSIDGYDPTGNG